MNVLEKIFEELEERGNIQFSSYTKPLIAVEDVLEIIRSHMDEAKDINVPSNDSWIPVEERLPKRGKLVRVTVHTSEWIGDYESNWVREQDKIYHPEEYNVYDGYLRSDGTWIFYDEYNAETTCVKEFGKDKGRIYDVVIAWMPVEVPEPYKPERDNDGA